MQKRNLIAHPANIVMSVFSVLLTALVIGAALFAVRPALAAGKEPDVLILVFAGLDGQDKVGMTYPSVVTRAQVMRDLQSLQVAAGWTPTKVNISEGNGPLQGTKQTMTSVEFISPNIIAPQGHYFAVEPVVAALRAYPHLGLTYFVGGKYDFQGLRTYTDKYVSIMLDQHGTAYTYDIHVRDPKFQKLNLPLSQLPNTEIKVASTPMPPAPRRVHPWQIALVAVLAGITAMGVYFVMTRNT